jgi:hypothetical protein
MLHIYVKMESKLTQNLKIATIFCGESSGERGLVLNSQPITVRLLDMRSDAELVHCKKS